MTHQLGLGTATEWEHAVATLRAVPIRPELIIEEVPAPNRLAPHSIALAVDAVGPDDEDLANGRLVVLHDPQEQETWDGRFRVVTFVRASVETEMVTDSMLDEVAWSWLTDALSDLDADHHNLSGTVTRTVSRPFAGLEGRDGQTDLEIRASWTPDSEDLAAHMQAWLAVVEKCAGLTPAPVGVAFIAPRKKSLHDS